TLSLQPEVTTRRVVVKARKGETLTRLAQRYGVSAASVADWNDLSAKATLKAGQSLTLHLPQRARPAATASRTTTAPPAAVKKGVVKKTATQAATTKKTAPSKSTASRASSTPKAKATAPKKSPR